MIYLVIRSADFYPAGGTGDWVLCTPGEATARARFAAERDHGDATELVAISPDGSYETVDSDG